MLKFLALLAVVGFICGIDGAPLQVLVPKEGYVPVYIREGSTPLAEINPELAEAFNETDSSAIALKLQSNLHPSDMLIIKKEPIAYSRDTLNNSEKVSIQKEDNQGEATNKEEVQ